MEQKQNSKTKLSEQFVVELCKACLVDKKVLEICSNYLKPIYLESQAQKKVFVNIIDTYQLSNKIPTLGSLSQVFNSDKDVLSFLKEVQKIRLNTDGREILIDQLEEFLRRRQFIQLFNTTHDLHQEGKQDKAISYMAEQSKAINEFTLKQKYYSTVFGDYYQREEQRVEKITNVDNLLKTKIPSGILQLDEIIYGGWRRGTSALLLGRSGQGKSTALRWFGISAARHGHVVVHFQAEGSEDECLEGYDAAWTGIGLNDFESEAYLNVSSKVKAGIKSARNSILNDYQGEIIVYAAEKFDMMTIERCRDILQDVVDIYGRVDLAIFDYLEIFSVSGRYANGDSGERKRREDIANKITNIAIEFNCASISATQANDIKAEKYNNPDFVMTRSDISEFKGCLKPFSYFITLNSTDDEYKNDIMRLYCDKFRRYTHGQIITIAQKKNIGRFYENRRTIDNFYKGRK